ncbi:hypothetical protein ABT095_38605 [Kitasatospora sp. NPDC002227]|uniref:hypothetical protein n=1 Tax=Kitasatospora sp. NPDC002227 TaxID=3154773 RepID=UPI0033248189
MNAQTRKAQQTRRDRAAQTRKAARNARAHAAVLSGRALPVAVVMAGAGYDAADISRNTSAISKKLGAADAMGKHRKRLTTKSPSRVNKGGRNRRMRTFPVKHYSAARVLGLLQTHRPKDKAVAARFEQVATSPKFRALALALAA